MKRTVLFFLFITAGLSVFAQTNAATWRITQRPSGDGLIELVFSADILPAWYIYGVHKMDGPMPTTIGFTANAAFEPVGALTEETPAKQKFDDIFETTVYYFHEKAVFIQTIKPLADAAFTVAGALEYQSCSDRECIPNEYAFSIDILPGGGAAAAEEESLWFFMLAALLAGLGAIIMPCIFPMIPMTVSFFMSGSSSRYVSLMKAVIFTLSVTLIYTLTGAIVAVFKTPAFANILSTHWVPNLLFAALFIVFALSFFGLFELRLPSGLANRADRQVDKGGYIASFFMAVVLAIVSFACTGPFVGSLLMTAAQGASVVKPIIGMGLFGLAMSLPFVLLVLFPSLLKRLPKSGGWLNAVKVVFAFIMLAFCVKFLAQVGQSLGVELITREVAVAFWLTLSVLLGCYILGKIKLPHDSETPRTGVGRLMLAIAAFTFAGYLLPGLLGGELNAVDPFLPAATKPALPLSGAPHTPAIAIPQETPCGNPPKYAGTKMHTPAGINGYFDLQQALDCAKTLNRPVLVDFTGHGCVNCKKMESSTFKDPRVVELINDRFVWVSLYYDENTDLPPEEQTADYKTIGKRNRAYQMETFKTVASPYFAIITADGEIQKQGLGLASAEAFLAWANEGINQ
ncbi:MAG: thioredoxin family protein [Prevotellaceae bacterium]|jgi:thiol:disulfide interchange protein DsbD|nr:thioredoxin family protein [Prevotellaceae bacterium]